jgi:hypothetical protein
LTVREDEGNLLFTLDYNSKLFKEETVKNYVSYFKEIITNVLENPWKKLKLIAGYQKRYLF